jgi:hypothetical protein
MCFYNSIVHLGLLQRKFSPVYLSGEVMRSVHCTACIMHKKQSVFCDSVPVLFSSTNKYRLRIRSRSYPELFPDPGIFSTDLRTYIVCIVQHTPQCSNPGLLFLLSCKKKLFLRDKKTGQMHPISDKQVLSYPEIFNEGRLMSVHCKNNLKDRHGKVRSKKTDNLHHINTVFKFFFTY